MQIKANDYESNEIIKFIREWTGLTQKQFGKSLYLSERSIQAYESGETKVRVETLLTICKIYGIDLIISKK